MRVHHDFFWTRNPLLRVLLLLTSCFVSSSPSSLRVAAFHIQDYATAKVALEECQRLSPEQRTLAGWIRKNEQELAKLPPAVAPTTPAPASAVVETPVSSPVASASPASTPVPTPLTPATHRVR